MLIHLNAAHESGRKINSEKSGKQTTQRPEHAMLIEATQNPKAMSKTPRGSVNISNVKIRDIVIGLFRNVARRNLLL